MTSPIPADIESGEQWQVRYEGLHGREIVQTGTRGQMLYVAKARREFGAILERRTITVGAWEPVDIDNPDGPPAGTCWCDGPDCGQTPCVEEPDEPDK